MGKAQTGVQLPAGLPRLADCGERCLATANDTGNDDATQSRALYTAVHNALSSGHGARAITYADLYLRRFPKGAEAAAVKQLKRIAGGE